MLIDFLTKLCSLIVVFYVYLWDLFYNFTLHILDSLIKSINYMRLNITHIIHSRVFIHSRRDFIYTVWALSLRDCFLNLEFCTCWQSDARVYAILNLGKALFYCLGHYLCRFTCNVHNVYSLFCSYKFQVRRNIVCGETHNKMLILIHLFICLVSCSILYYSNIFT